MNNQPSSSRSITLSPEQNQQDPTWLDFIRSAGNTVPISRDAGHTDADPSTRTASADRKRRHAASSPERRAYRYPDHAIRPPTGTRDAPLDLTSPPPPPRSPRPFTAHPRTSSSTESMRAARAGIRNVGLGSTVRGTASTSSSRRESDFALPRWQPDGEVSACPVCHTDFHFFYRKHHCRKCGRVVCAACSPHRITIPRQYIVQAPSGEDDGESGGAGLFGRNLGGGENVRVCNPCVPDPWTPDALLNGSAGELGRREGWDGPGVGRRTSEVGGGPQQQPSQPDRYRGAVPPPPFFPPPRNDSSSGRARAQTHQPASTAPTYVRNIPQPPQQQPRTNASHSLYNRSTPPPIPSRQHPRHTHSQSQSSSSVHPLPPPPRLPRREVREEDECPVCGTELPPNPTIRESHIQDCITTRFSSGTPSQTSTIPFAPPATANPADPTTTAVGNRPRTTSYRPRGMAVYRATEKDCLDESGEAQECVICFEEFQPGDEMGRMECWCKFHRVCIRRWWEMRGGGSCPTHQLHE